jgi:hypothetical protein
MTAGAKAKSDKCECERLIGYRRESKLLGKKLKKIEAEKADNHRKWYENVCFDCSGFSERAKYFKKRIKELEASLLKEKSFTKDFWKQQAIKKNKQIGNLTFLADTDTKIIKQKNKRIKDLEKELGKVLEDLAKCEKTKRVYEYEVEKLDTLELKEKAPLCWTKLQQFKEKMNDAFAKKGVDVEVKG